MSFTSPVCGYNVIPDRCSGTICGAKLLAEMFTNITQIINFLGNCLAMLILLRKHCAALNDTVGYSSRCTHKMLAGVDF